MRALVAKACRIIEESEEEPSLDDLADVVGRSPSYFHRMFKATTGRDAEGLCRRASCEEGPPGTGIRQQRHRSDLRRRLQFQRTVLREVDGHAGHDAVAIPRGRHRTRRSSSRSGRPLSAPSSSPPARRASRRSSWETTRTSSFVTSRIASQERISLAPIRSMRALVARVVGFVETPEIGLDLPLDVRGTAFQQRVWRALREIPVGETVSLCRDRAAHRSRRRRYARSPVRAPQTTSRSPFPVTAWCARTVRCRDMPGASSASASCSTGKTPDGIANYWPAFTLHPTGRTMYDLLQLAEPLEPSTEDHGGRSRAYCAARHFRLKTGFWSALNEITAISPFRHMVTPGGYTMSVAMTNCGAAGWVTDRTGYRYDPKDPETGKPWPPMPDCFLDLAVAAATEAGYPEFRPDACLINRYEPGARLSLHQDKNERDFANPIVSVSLGLPATFQFGGLKRNDPVKKFVLQTRRRCRVGRRVPPLLPRSIAAQGRASRDRRAHAHQPDVPARALSVGTISV